MPAGRRRHSPSAATPSAGVSDVARADQAAAAGANADGSLSAEDLYVLRLLAEGVAVDAVARRLGLSERTVRRRVRGVCDRLQVQAPVQAIVWAARRGLL